MGSSASKPNEGSAVHVWKAPSPPSLSRDLTESLRASPETDTSRQQTVELQIQARVAAELERLAALQAAVLREALEKAKDPSNGSSEPREEDAAAGPSRVMVSHQVEKLQQRLDERRRVIRLPDVIQKARGDLTRCLRKNDRRPLDCWREVERFKDEVRRLEKQWVYEAFQ